MAEPVDAEAAVRRARALAAERPSWTVLIDGRSGSGKSTLADRIAQRTGAAVVRLDDVYPGWDGLAAGAEAVLRGVLLPRASGRPGAYRRWDWPAGHPADRTTVPPGGGLVVEGCGVLTRRSAAIVELALWLELDEPERYRRAMDRDGDAFRAHWRQWAEQEDAVIAAEHPAALADLLVDGSSVQRLPSGRSPSAQ